MRSGRAMALSTGQTEQPDRNEALSTLLAVLGAGLGGVAGIRVLRGGGTKSQVNFIDHLVNTLKKEAPEATYPLERFYPDVRIRSYSKSTQPDFAESIY